MMILIWFMYAMLSIVVALVYFGIRNEWVCKVRNNIIDESMVVYRTMPTYDYMLYRKWYVWDVEKFITRENDEPDERR